MTSRPSVEQVAEVIDGLNVSGWRVVADPGTGEPVQEQVSPGEVAHAFLRLFEPETVTTADELDALPVGSVVLDRAGRAWEKRAVPPDGFQIDVGWYRAGSPSYMKRAPRPATVLYRGES